MMRVIIYVNIYIYIYICIRTYIHAHRYTYQRAVRAACRATLEDGPADTTSFQKLNLEKWAQPLGVLNCQRAC